MNSVLLCRTEGKVYPMGCWAELRERFIECVVGQK